MPKTLDELIDAQEPGWPAVQRWLAKARRPVEVLDVPPARAKGVLLALQVATRSPMGAIAFQTGGLLGWQRPRLFCYAPSRCPPPPAPSRG